MTEISFRRFGVADLPGIRKALLDVYAEVYAADLHDPFNSIERFDERLTGHARSDDWECVLAYAAREPIGYAYGSALPAGTLRWTRQSNKLPAEFTHETGHRSVSLRELMLLRSWRGHGLGRRIHDELLAGRAEERVVLLCDGPDRRAMYEAWGYRCVGTMKPFPDSPLFFSMVRPVDGAAGLAGGEDHLRLSDRGDRQPEWKRTSRSPKCCG